MAGSLARRFATLDGRAIAGLGIGWSKDEYQVSNIPFENKGRRADEIIHVKKISKEDMERRHRRIQRRIL